MPKPIEPSRKHVLDLIRATGRPMSALEILDALKGGAPSGGGGAPEAG